jgi:hypothetical protein
VKSKIKLSLLFPYLWHIWAEINCSKCMIWKWFFWQLRCKVIPIGFLRKGEICPKKGICVHVPVFWVNLCQSRVERVEFRDEFKEHVPVIWVNLCQSRVERVEFRDEFRDFRFRRWTSQQRKAATTTKTTSARNEIKIANYIFNYLFMLF